MSDDAITVRCGPVDRRNERKVVAVVNGHNYYEDRFCTDIAWKREQWRDRVRKQFDLDGDWNPSTGTSHDRLYRKLDSLLAEAVQKADEEDERFQPRPVEKFTLTALSQQYNELPPTVIEGVAREGETINGVAASKVGKTWLFYALLLAVITGRRWLDTFATSKGRVLLVDNELHRATIASRLAAVGEAMDLFPADYANDLDVWPLRGQLRSLTDLMDDFEQIEPGQYKLIVLDALYRFCIDGVSENDNAAMARVYNLLDKIAATTKAAVLVVHHSTKGSQSDKRVTDVGAGAGAQSRAADCHLILREHEEDDVFVMEAAVRSFKPVEPVALRWNFPLWHLATDADPNKLRGTKSRKDEKQAEKDREGFEQILGAICQNGPLTPSRVREHTGLSRDRAARLLSLLVAEGHLEATDIVARGNQTKEYKLPI